MASLQPSDATPVSSGSAEPTLEVSGVSKTYLGVKALRGVSLSFVSGEAHAIAGQNGAGKSTLIRILSGAEEPDTGSISVLGSPVSFDTPACCAKSGDCHHLSRTQPGIGPLGG